MASTEEPPSDDAIVEESDGWGELTLPADVYSCAFVLASNSTDAMYIPDFGFVFGFLPSMAPCAPFA